MITSKTISNGILRALLTVVLSSLVFFFFYKIQSALIYLAVSLILTLIGLPILHFFKKRLKFSHLFATIATVFIFILIILGFIMMFIPLILSQGQNLSLLNTTEIEKNIGQLLNQFALFLNSYHIDSSAMLKESNITSKINFNLIPNFLNTILATISSFGIGLGAVLFITFFFLKDRVIFIKGARKLIPDSHEDKILNSLDKINNLLSRYFIGLLLQLFIVFLLYLIVLVIFGIPNAVIIAFLGSDFQSELLPTTIYVLIGFWIIQIIDNNLSQPIIFSKSVSSHPLEIFLVILIAGYLFGILGMIVAVPFYTIIKVIGKEFFPENMLIRLLTKNL